jgi:Mg2+ and Co2+ transporter CorA
MPCAARRPGSSPSGAWGKDVVRGRCAPAATEAGDLDDVRTRLASGEHFWLDVGRPADDEIDELGELLELHPLARDDLGDFGQRAKADDYPAHTLLVVYGATHDEHDSLVEVHAVVAESWLVTVHTETCPAFIDLRKRTMRGGRCRRRPR